MSLQSYFLSLGSNQGDRLEALRQAQEAINALNHTHITKVSKVYETSPVGVKSQPDFLNMVLECQSREEPFYFLGLLKEIEERFGRDTTKVGMPRIIDIDIIFVDDLIIAEDALIVPHPECHKRRFVLAPFMDICPSFKHPILEKSIKDLYEDCLEETQDKAYVYQPQASPS